MNKGTILLLSFFLLTSCAWLDQSEHHLIIDNYEVGWNDLESNRAITKSIDACEGCYDVIIDGYIFAVGNNDNYIIAKQHQAFDTTITYYYIINLRINRKNNRNGIYGPINESEFNVQKKKLNIEHLKFNKTYSEMPRI
ncbi:MAG: hypothetical protein RL222_918 [Bacteroidota bacterium]|jgi:hypothetical protein